MLRKEQAGFAGSILNVQDFVNEYNTASQAEKREIEKTYLYRRLTETGIVISAD